ncbi:MAG: DUF4157 domain-containing protein [Dehalococcoidia bacterium]
MAERESRKAEEERTQRRQKVRQSPSKQLEARDPGSEIAVDVPSAESPGVLRDGRFSHPANIGQKARVVSQLQRSHGNVYVQRLLESKAIQAKLVVNPVNDEYEREADRVAEVFAPVSQAPVQRQPEEEEEELQMKPASSASQPVLQRQPEEEEEELQMKPASSTPQPALQRQPEEEEEELQMKPASSASQSVLQRQVEEEEEELQAKPAGTRLPQASPDMEAHIEATRGRGQPLGRSERASLEPRLGVDLSDVRIHADAEADQLSRNLNAKAFTTGKDVFFREGDYQPGSPEGKRLLAHELTHVVQQNPTARQQRPGSQRGGAGASKLEPRKRRQSVEPPRSMAGSSVQYVSRYPIGEERRGIERRTGPLVEPIAGPPRVGVSETHTVELRGLLRTCFNTRNDAASDALTDFVRHHDREANYGPLSAAIVAAPLGILGACLSGPAGLAVAVASASVAVISSVPAAPSPMTEFTDRMRDAFDRVTENRYNSVDAIVSNYIMGVTPEIAGDLGRMRRDLVSRCFPGRLRTGEAVNATEVRRVVTRELDRRWAVVERRRRRLEAERWRELSESGTFGYRTQ